MEQKRFVIIDGNAIIHRAYHALPPLTVQGTMVNAVYGFTSMLLKVLNDLKPDYIAVSFDVEGPTFRDTLYKEYKATRVKADQSLYDQIPLCYDVVNAFNIPIFTKQGYEADDVIATVVAKTRNSKPEIRNIIVTGDADLLQLVDDGKVEVFLLRKGLSDIGMYDEKAVKEKYGFGPEHIVDYKALKGDASDNIPGVSGIGEKTATQLITEVGSIEDIYKQIRNPKFEIRNKFKSGIIEKLKTGEKDSVMSKKLATIVRDVPSIDFNLEKCVTHEFDREKVVKLLQKFEFFSLVKRIPGGTSEVPTGEDRRPKTGDKKRDKKLTLTIVDTTNIEVLMSELRKADAFACKEILSGADVLTSELKGVVFVMEGGAWFVQITPPLPLPTGQAGSPTRGGYTVEVLSEIFADAKKILIGHDVKQLIKALAVAPARGGSACGGGIEVKNKLFDVMIASYLLNSSTRAHDMRSIVLRELGKELPAGSDQGSLFGADPQVAAMELEYMSQIHSRYEKKLREHKEQDLFVDIEMPLIPVLSEMELYGIAVDAEQLRVLSKDVAKAIDAVTKKIWKEAGIEFNVASSQQLRHVLFEKMEIPLENIKKGKTGLSTAASELEKLRGVHPIIEMIEEHRELSKLQNTYVDVLPTLINKKTGRIHTSFNQAVATTGRLSSSDPNLQNIPIRTELGKEIRDTFIAERGYVLIAADYSQIELRIVAHLAHDKRMIEIFKKGEDIHRATAAAIHNVPLDKVTKEMRYAAKEVNFGVLYGMGAYGLAWRTKIPQWQAKEFIEKYFREFSGVKKYVDETIKSARQKGYVETLFGRRRYIPELQSPNHQLRAAGERMAVNMPIQGTAADVMKVAMIRVNAEIRNPKSEILNPDNTKMILQVHDELVVEVKKGLEDGVAKMLKEAMEEVMKLDVPIEVHVAVGKRWGELK